MWLALGDLRVGKGTMRMGVAPQVIAYSNLSDMLSSNAHQTAMMQGMPPLQTGEHIDQGAAACDHSSQQRSESSVVFLNLRLRNDRRGVEVLLRF